MKAYRYQSIYYKRSRIFHILGIIILAIGLASCPSSPSGPSNPNPPSSEYTIEVRGGTTNIDSSFFNLSLSTSSSRALDQQNYVSETAKILETHGVSFFPQATQVIGINLFTSVLKAGKPLTEKTTLTFSGPEGVYDNQFELKDNEAWNVFFPLVPKGNGIYKVVAKNGTNTLSASTDINLTNPSLLPIPKNITASAGGNALIAEWDAVEGAKSYIVLGYDSAQQAYIWSGATNTSKIVGRELTAPQTPFVQLTIFALSWDLTQPTSKPLNPLPKRFDASVASQQVVYITDNPRLELSQQYFGLTVKSWRISFYIYFNE